MKKVIYKTNQNNPQIRAYKQAVERGKQNHHVIHKDNSWVVIRGGAERASDIFKTQKAAIDRAKSIAQNQGTSVYIHRADGRIRTVEDY
ncbi:DUF2188 domain-containing protein [Candidatus Daviesbacteria bacterium]|nr:DUF2188 domain-containing protein [Candidatus Daviesbacteria bacterium]